MPISREFPLELIEFDEIGALVRYVGDRKTREAIAERVALLTTQGRALGYSVGGYVQEPTKTPSRSGSCSRAASASASPPSPTCRERFGTGPDGLLFRGVRGGELAESMYCRVWRKARGVALTAEEARSPLAARPYDLRHAAVSTWLNAGVPSTQVAEWAGHSVGVLHQIYAKCIVGQEDAARKRITAALAVTPDA